MKAWDILGYTYDADVHCEKCAEKRFGKRLFDDKHPPEDSEGNEVHPIFASDEMDPAGEVCCDCGDVVVEPAEEEEED